MSAPVVSGGARPGTGAPPRTPEDAPTLLTRHIGSGDGVERRARERQRALSALGRRDVLAAHEVVAEAGTVCVRVPLIDGVDLASLATMRAPLSAGEVAWLGTAVARALAAMHAAGLAHTDLSPANVVVTAAGVTLVDTFAAVRRDERGTPGFRAPEAHAGAAEAAADVYSLGRLLRWAACGEDEQRVRAWTRTLVAPRAGDRPSAADAADLLAACSPLRAITPPPRPDVAQAVRSRALARTERVAAGRWWRIRRLALRGGTVASAIAAAAWLTVAVPGLLDDASGAAPDPAQGQAERGDLTLDAPKVADAARVRPRPPARDSPSDAAAQLTERRIEALAAGDGDALVATVEESTALAREAHATAERLAAGDLAYDALAVEVESSTVLTESRFGAIVAVTYVISPHAEVDAGRAVSRAGGEQRVELDLAVVDGEWRVRDARPG